MRAFISVVNRQHVDFPHDVPDASCVIYGSMPERTLKWFEPMATTITGLFTMRYVDVPPSRPQRDQHAFRLLLDGSRQDLPKCAPKDPRIIAARGISTRKLSLTVGRTLIPEESNSPRLHVKNCRRFLSANPSSSNRSSRRCRSSICGR